MNILQKQVSVLACLAHIRIRGACSGCDEEALCSKILDVLKQDYDRRKDESKDRGRSD